MTGYVFNVKGNEVNVNSGDFECYDNLAIVRGGCTWALTSKAKAAKEAKMQDSEIVEADVFDVIIKDYYYTLLKYDFRVKTQNGHKVERVLQQLVADRLNELNGVSYFSKDDVIID